MPTRKHRGDAVAASALADLLLAISRGREMDEAIREARLDRNAAEKLLRRLLTAFEQTATGEPRDRGAGSVSRDTPDSRSMPPPGSVKGRMIFHADGASRGNPGEGACAVIVLDEGGEELLRRSKRLGVVTNNVAEYEAVLLALAVAKQLGASDIVLKLDSELVVNQLNGRYKVKNAGLQPLHARAKLMLGAFSVWRAVYIPRKENAAADKLANETLDGKA